MIGGSLANDESCRARGTMNLQNGLLSTFPISAIMGNFFQAFELSNIIETCHAMQYDCEDWLQDKVT